MGEASRTWGLQVRRHHGRVLLDLSFPCRIDSAGGLFGTYPIDPDGITSESTHTSGIVSPVELLTTDRGSSGQANSEPGSWLTRILAGTMLATFQKNFSKERCLQGHGAHREPPCPL